jgi:hypothetical protein
MTPYLFGLLNGRSDGKLLVQYIAAIAFYKPKRLEPAH